jgi:sec-independent protein translocase protein TatA
MLGDLFTGPHLIIVLLIVVLLFGATRLPALARSLGQSRNAFRAEMKKGEGSDPTKTDPAAPNSDGPTDTTPKP